MNSKDRKTTITIEVEPNSYRSLRAALARIEEMLRDNDARPFAEDTPKNVFDDERPAVWDSPLPPRDPEDEEDDTDDYDYIRDDQNFDAARENRVFGGGRSRD